MVFSDYARYYNLLYRDKNYKKEVEYIDALIKQYASHCKKDLLDVGCGTGRHDFLFADKGYRVVGIDKSANMISLANASAQNHNKVAFYISDSARFRLYRKFDIAVSLFHVIDYITDNEYLYKSFKNIYTHLNEKGLFIFDFWYGPAVIAQKPEIRTKRIRTGSISIERRAKPILHINENTVDIEYVLRIKNKRGKVIRCIKEGHTMRYFFLPELRYLLKSVGFKILNCMPWLSLKKKLSQRTWSAVIVAQK